MSVGEAITTQAGQGIGLIAVDTPFARHVALRLRDQQAGGIHPLRALLVLDKASAAARTPTPRRIPGLHRAQRLISAKARRNHAVWLQEQAALQAFERAAGPLPDWPEIANRQRLPVSSANAPETVAWLAALDLRLLVLAGAPILKPPMLATVPETLNMHSALLPRYRGTRAEFWQYYNGELDQAGVSVHYVTAGVDAGDIVLQVPLNPDPADGPWLMRIRNQLNGLDALPRAVAQVLAGTAQRRPQGETEERAYRYSDITDAATRRVLQMMKQ